MNAYELLEKIKSINLDEKKVKKLKKMLRKEDARFAKDLQKKKITDEFLEKHYSHWDKIWKS